MTTKAVAKKKTTDVSTELLDDIFEHAGEGASFDSSEMMIPFVRLAQALSPQLNKKKPEFIEGLSVGDAFNSVTGDRWDGETGITVVVCFQCTKYLEFIPREQGGGFRGEIDPRDPILQRTVRDSVTNREILPHGNECVKTDQNFCLLLGEDGMYQPVVIDMKSTQLKVSRRWKTQIAMRKLKNPKTGLMVTPPVYATTWQLHAVEETNEKGDFYNWVVTPGETLTSRDIYEAAKAFRASVIKGEAKAVEEDYADGGAAGDRAGAMSEEDIPF